MYHLFVYVSNQTLSYQTDEPGRSYAKCPYAVYNVFCLMIKISHTMCAQVAFSPEFDYCITMYHFYAPVKF